MSEPVSLAAARLAPRPEVVEMLEDLLARAKSGEIRGIAVAAGCDAGSDGSAFEVGDSSIASLYLGMERLKLRLLEYEGD